MSVHVMNPTSMLRQQLLGEMSHDTREFRDGVLTMSTRKVVKNHPKHDVGLFVMEI